jgi:hypothetical protein
VAVFNLTNALLAAIVLLGAYALWSGVRQRSRAQASSGWPSVQGRALSAEVKTRVSRNTKSHVTHRSYVPSVEYEYLVDGAAYRSSQVVFGELSSTLPADAQHIISETVKGDTVQVFYNPQNPQEAVLVNAKAPGSSRRIAVGALVVLVAGFVLLYSVFIVG